LIESEGTGRPNLEELKTNHSEYHRICHISPFVLKSVSDSRLNCFHFKITVGIESAEQISKQYTVRFEKNKI
jgi:hypothetical protein